MFNSVGPSTPRSLPLADHPRAQDPFLLRPFVVAQINCFFFFLMNIGAAFSFKKIFLAPPFFLLLVKKADSGARFLGSGPALSLLSNFFNL